jgi:hypothetical protein
VTREDGVRQGIAAAARECEVLRAESRADYDRDMYDAGAGGAAATLGVLADRLGALDQAAIARGGAS